MSETGKYTEFDATRGSAHNLVVSLVPAGAKVLEFGCATGYMSAVLKTQRNCSVTGVEYAAGAAALARAHCEQVIVGDAETLNLGEHFRPGQFDAILFADVLEHLREPEALLRRVRSLLADGGAVIASIPNIAHGSVRLALLDGEFRYRDKGLLDNTHLRFFTRASVQDLFEGAGYLITHWLRRRLEINQSEIPVPVWPLPEAVRSWLAQDPEVTTYQFVVRAVRAEAAEALRQARAELEAAKAGHAWLHRLYSAAQELAALIPPGDSFILADEGQFGDGFTAGRRALPFMERVGQYWGPPADDEAAVGELERLRQAGANFIAFGWPAFWWLDYYSGFQHHLRQRFHCILENDRLVVFDLRS
jgi:2-polyprenyl-3-methyl-5-hydroxy-6-metoxy-1,4-benzoquinol methylase